MNILCPQCTVSLDMSEVTGSFGNILAQPEKSTPTLQEHYNVVELMANSQNGRLNLRREPRDMKLFKIQWRPFNASVVRIRTGDELLAVSDEKKFRTEYPVEEAEFVEKFFTDNLNKYEDVSKLTEHIRYAHAGQLYGLPLRSENNHENNIKAIIQKAGDLYMEKIKMHEEFQQKRLLDFLPAFSSTMTNAHVILKLVKHEMEQHCYTDFSDQTESALKNVKVWEVALRNLLGKPDRCDHCIFRSRNYCLH